MSKPYSRTLRTSVALMLAGVLVGTAAAQSNPRVDRLKAKIGERFAAADQDRDGRLSRAEAEAGMPFVHRNFDKIDSAGAGSLSQDDILAWMAAQAAARKR